MNLEETRKILTIVRVNYFEQIKKLTKKEMNEMLEMWHIMFQEYNYDQVAAALYLYIKNDDKGFYPKVGQLITLIKECGEHDLKVHDAWDKVLVALKDRYYAENFFNEFDGITKKVIGSYKRLIEWSNLNDNTINGSIRTQFYKDYEKEVESSNLKDQFKNIQLMIKGSTTPEIETK